MVNKCGLSPIYRAFAIAQAGTKRSVHQDDRWLVMKRLRSLVKPGELGAGGGATQ